MESDRCKVFVKNELIRLGIPYKKIELGEITLLEKVSNEKMVLMETALRDAGLELMEDRKSHLVEKIKTVNVDYLKIEQ